MAKHQKGDSFSKEGTLKSESEKSEGKNEHLSQLIAFANQVRHDVKKIVRDNPLPMGDLKLDLESREGDVVRQFKYIHQSSMFSIRNFMTANIVKLAHLIDGYLAMCEARNPLGVYLFSRSVLELNALNFYVSERLKEFHIDSIGDPTWKKKSIDFFEFTISARYGTSDKKTRALLKSKGLSNKRIDPIRVQTCRAYMANHPKYKDLVSKYGDFCEYVHHNFSSNTIAIRDTNYSRVALNQQGDDGFVFAEDIEVTRYEYPSTQSAEEAINDTIDDFMKNASMIYDTTAKMKQSPFSEGLVIKMTGNKLGARNDPCPCGSGKKYKKCCGAPPTIH